MSTTPDHKCCSCLEIHWKRSDEQQARLRELGAERDGLRTKQDQLILRIRYAYQQGWSQDSKSRLLAALEDKV